ncbi:MAG: nucleotide pyrophosphohydrolase [Nanoarchaeota archaeon]|nr:nucleotide pyrophosphohydrolase [Nanoarchaeota archaeon]
MTLKDIQDDVNRWASQFNFPYWPPLDQLARLTEETGEVAREMNHLYGSKKKKPDEKPSNLSDELIDVIFTCVCIANREGIDLQEQWTKTMQEKHYKRDNDRYERKP